LAKAKPGASGKAADASAGKAARPTPAAIVGVGASAGGLEAFTQLLEGLPANSGMGFVLVQHLDPSHGSALTQLLARATAMPVREVENDTRIEANCVYVIPPGANLTVAGGILKLQRRALKRHGNRTIDQFFESLAEDQRQRAIGIVLSGTGTDGTQGLEAIKADGGITFAQDESARYDSMPRSAIAAGVVDYVLSPHDTGAELARIARHAYVADAGAEAAPPSRPRSQNGDAAGSLPGEGLGGRDSGNGFKKVLLLLRNYSGVDFSLYKPNTIQRRIARRMLLSRHDKADQYATFLKHNAAELDRLYADLLIGVTGFFRNPDAFELLRLKIFPTILKRRRRDDPVRLWTLGCATGQEAYSLAMVFAEAAETFTSAPKLQIFATDLNEALLSKARSGLYSQAAVQDISPQRLRRFFVAEEGGYRVSKAVREQVVFARQNVLNDPPFSWLDLISCRNLLIYLDAGLQRKIIPAFHYALKPDGFLFLGASESVGPFGDLFEPVDKKHKIYARKSALTPEGRLPMPGGIAPAALAGMLPHPGAAAGAASHATSKAGSSAGVGAAQGAAGAQTSRAHCTARSTRSANRTASC